MTESRGAAPEPEESRPSGEREAGEQEARVQETRGLVRRMMRNGDFRLIEVEPARTPHETIMEWAVGLTGKPAAPHLAELADRLRDALAYEEDGALAGQRVVDALTVQAGLIRDWPHRARLKTLAGQLDALLREMGML